MKRLGFWLPPTNVIFNNFKVTKTKQQQQRNKNKQTNKQKKNHTVQWCRNDETYVQVEMTKANANGLSGFLRDARAG